MNQALDRDAEIARRRAQARRGARRAVSGPRRRCIPLALEGALKLKEISYIHAEGYASGELKHGPIALIDETVPVIVMAPRDALFDKTVSNMQEVMARGGKVLLITDAQGAAEAGDGVWQSLIDARCRPAFRADPLRDPGAACWPITPPWPRAPMSTSRAIWRNP